MIEITEEGYVEVAISSGETRVEKRLDLYQVWNHLWQLVDDFKGKSDEELNRAFVQYLESLGYPTCSHGTAAKVHREINKLVGELQKKDSASGKPG